MAGFSPGTNALYTSGVAQGLDAVAGYLHRNEGVGSLATWPEVPSMGNGSTSNNSAEADLDGDGDPDVLMVNDLGQPNRCWRNALGVPDTHAPVIHQLTVQGDKADGTDTVIHAALRDNSSNGTIHDYRVNLFYSVDAGDEACVDMSSMRGQLFRGVIPGGVDGLVAYRVEATDMAGGTGLSATISYQQTALGAVLWENLGHGTPGAHGVPDLRLLGSQVPGSPITLSLRHAPASSLRDLDLVREHARAGHRRHALRPLTTDDGGLKFLSVSWPAGLPSGTDHTWQAVIADGTSIHGLVLSNAVHGVQP